MKIKPLEWKDYLRLIRIARVESTEDWQLHVTNDGIMISLNRASYDDREFWETRDLVAEDIYNAKPAKKSRPK